MKKIHNGWIENVLFSDDEFIKEDDVDVYYFISEYENPRGKIITEHYTHLLDLTSLDGIRGYKKNKKWTVNKKYKDFEYKIQSEISDKEAKYFLDKINSFHAWAKLPEYDDKFFKALLKKGLYIISTISKETKNIAGIATYLKVDDKARLLNLISIEDEDMDARTLAIHHAIQNLHDHGFKYMDFGGAGLINNPSQKMLNIRSYKGGFGGELTKYYKGRLAGSQKGELIIKEQFNV